MRADFSLHKAVQYELDFGGIMTQFEVGASATEHRESKGNSTAAHHLIASLIRTPDDLKTPQNESLKGIFTLVIPNGQQRTFMNMKFWEQWKSNICQLILSMSSTWHWWWQCFTLLLPTWKQTAVVEIRYLWSCDISRFSPQIDLIFPWEALNPFFCAQDEGFLEFRSR